MSDKLEKLTKEFNNKPTKVHGEKSTYFAKLFEASTWLPKLRGVKLSSSKLSEPSKPILERKSPEVVIKPQAIVEATQKKTGPVIPLKSKAQPSKVVSSTIKINKTLDEFLKSYNSDWSVETIAGISHYNDSVDIIFFGLDEMGEDELPDFTPLSMIESDQDIMGRMIKAMKIPSGRFIRIPYIKENAHEFIFTCCAHFKPSILIPLGASATKLCLGKKLRLANVHGQFSSVSIEVDGNSQSIEVMPLFHPKLLEVNESMKKTAWVDMQKAINFIKKDV